MARLVDDVEFDQQTTVTPPKKQQQAPDKGHAAVAQQVSQPSSGAFKPPKFADPFSGSGSTAVREANSVTPWFQSNAASVLGDGRTPSQSENFRLARMQLNEMQRIEWADRAGGGMLPTNLVMAAAESNMDDWELVRASSIMAKTHFLPMATWFSPISRQGEGLFIDRMTGRPLTLEQARRLYKTYATDLFEGIFNAPYDARSSLRKTGPRKRSDLTQVNPFAKVDPLTAAYVWRSMAPLKGEELTWEEALGYTAMVTPMLKTVSQARAFANNVRILAADEYMSEKDVLIIAAESAAMDFRFSDDPLSERHPVVVFSANATTNRFDENQAAGQRPRTSAQLYVAWKKAKEKYKDEVEAYKEKYNVEGFSLGAGPYPTGDPGDAPGMSQFVIEQQQVIEGLLTDEESVVDVASGETPSPHFAITEEEYNALTGAQKVVADLVTGTRQDFVNNWKNTVISIKTVMTAEEFAAHDTILGKAKDYFGEVLRLFEDAPRADAYAIWGAIDWLGTTLGNELRPFLGKEKYDSNQINAEFWNRLVTARDILIHPNHRRFDLNVVLTREEGWDPRLAFAATLALDLAADPANYYLKGVQLNKLRAAGMSVDDIIKNSHINWNLMHRAFLKPELIKAGEVSLTKAAIDAFEVRHLSLGRRTIPQFLINSAGKYDDLVSFRYWAGRRLRNVFGQVDALSNSVSDMVFRLGKLYHKGELARYGVRTEEDAAKLVQELLLYSRFPGRDTPKVLDEIVSGVELRRRVAGTVAQTAKKHKEFPMWVTPWGKWDETAEADDYVEAIGAFKSAQGSVVDTVIGGERLFATPVVKNPLSIGWLKTKEQFQGSRLMINSRYRRSMMGSSVASLEGGQLPSWTEQVMLRSKGLFSLEEIGEWQQRALRVQSKLNTHREVRFINFVTDLQSEIVTRTAKFYGANAEEVDHLVSTFREATAKFNSHLFGADPKAIEEAFLAAKGDPDVYLKKLEAILEGHKHPQMASQLTNNWIMMDPVKVREIVSESLGYSQRMRQAARRLIVEKIPGTLVPVEAGVERTLHRVTTNQLANSFKHSVIDNYTRLWKASVVATPRYVLRVPLGDEQFRFLWDLGVNEWMDTRRISALARRKLLGESAHAVVVEVNEDAFRQAWEQVQRLGVNFAEFDEAVMARWRIVNNIPMPGDIEEFKKLPDDVKNMVETILDEHIAIRKAALKGKNFDDVDPEWREYFGGLTSEKAPLAVANAGDVRQGERPFIAINLDASAGKLSFEGRVTRPVEGPEDLRNRLGPLTPNEEKTYRDLERLHGSPKDLVEKIASLREKGDLQRAHQYENTLRYWSGLDARRAAGSPIPEVTQAAGTPGIHLVPGHFQPITDSVSLDNVEDIRGAERIVVLGSPTRKTLDADLDAIKATHAREFSPEVMARLQELGIIPKGRNVEILTVDDANFIIKSAQQKGLTVAAESRSAAGQDFFRQVERLMGLEKTEVRLERVEEIEDELKKLGLWKEDISAKTREAKKIPSVGEREWSLRNVVAQAMPEEAYQLTPPDVVIVYLDENGLWREDNRILHALAVASENKLPIIVRGKKYPAEELGRVVQKYADDTDLAQEARRFQEGLQGPGARYGDDIEESISPTTGKEYGTRRVGVEHVEGAGRKRTWDEPQVRISIKAQARRIQNLDQLELFLAELDPSIRSGFMRDLYVHMKADKGITDALDTMKSLLKRDFDSIAPGQQRAVLKLLNGGADQATIPGVEEIPSFGTQVVSFSRKAETKILENDPDWVYIDAAGGWPSKDNFEEWARHDGNYAKVRELAGRNLVAAPGREKDAEFLRQLAEDYALEDLAPIKHARKVAKKKGADTESWQSLGDIFAAKTPENPVTGEEFMRAVENESDIAQSIKRIWIRLRQDERDSLVDDFMDTAQRWTQWAEERLRETADVDEIRALKAELNDMKAFLRPLNNNVDAMKIVRFFSTRPAVKGGLRELFFEWHKAVAQEFRQWADEGGDFGATFRQRFGTRGTDEIPEGAHRGYWLNEYLKPEEANDVSITISHEMGHHLLELIPADVRADLEEWFKYNKVVPRIDGAVDMYEADLADEIHRRWAGLHPSAPTDEQADAIDEFHEFFADAWAAYNQKPDVLKAVDPALFDFFRRNEARFNGVLESADIEIKWLGAMKLDTTPRYSMKVPLAGDITENSAVAAGRHSETFLSQTTGRGRTLEELGKRHISNERYYDEIKETQEQYYPALVHVLQQQVGNDFSGQIALEGIRNGWSPKQIADEIVRRYSNEAAGIAESKRLNLTTPAQIRTRAEKIERMVRNWTFNNPAIADAVEAGVSRKRMEKLLQDAVAEARVSDPNFKPMPVHGFAVEDAYGTGDMMHVAWGKISRSIFEHPTNKFSRHPYYRGWYKLYKEGLLDEMVKEGIGWSPRVAQQIEAQAQALAIQRTKKVMFDFKEQSRFSEMIGFMVPFHQAWKEAWQVYGHLLNKNPAFAYQAYMVFRDLDQAGYTPRDPFTGQRIIPLSNWMFMSTFLNAAFGGLKENGNEVGGWSLAGPLQSLNFLFGSFMEVPTEGIAGNVPVPVPSTAPAVTALVQNLLTAADGVVPDHLLLPLTRWAYQYGDVSDGGNFFRSLLPSYVDHALTGFGFAPDQSVLNSVGDDFIRLYETEGITAQALAADEDLAKEVAGHRFANVKEAQVWLADKALQQAQDLYKWRAFFSAFSPIAPSIKFPTQHLEVEFRELVEEHDDYDKALDIFSKRYDGAYDMITVPTSMWAKVDGSLVPLPANELADRILSDPNIQEAARKNPMWAFAFLTPEVWEEDFDLPIFLRQLDEGLRLTADPLEFQTAGDVRRGWEAWRGAYELYQQDLQLLDEEDISTQSVSYQLAGKRFDEAVDNIATLYPGWKDASDTITRYNYDPWVETNVQAALHSDIFRETTIGQGLIAYRDLRLKIQARMKALNISTLDTKSAETYGLAKAFEQGKKQIEKEYEGMDRVFSVFFSSDLQGIETRGDKLVAEVDEAGLLPVFYDWEKNWYSHRENTRTMNPGPERDFEYFTMRDMANEATKTWGYTFRNPMYVYYESLPRTEQDSYKLMASLRPMNYLSRFDREHVLGIKTNNKAEEMWLQVGRIDLEINRARRANPDGSFGDVYEARDKIVRKMMNDSTVFRRQVHMADEWGGLFWQSYELHKQEGDVGAIWRGIRSTLDSMRQVVYQEELHGEDDPNPANRAKWRAMQYRFIDYIETLKAENPMFKNQWVHLEEQTFGDLIDEFIPETYYRLGG